ncbi:MAG: hypothetical protein J5692_02475 [Bacteroidales bacterium]|nr:hypothetical protein [Bacteroidales bacterium]
MKKFINILLLICIAALVYINVESVMGPIRFDNEKKVRDEAVKQSLINIRTAQVEFHNQHDGRYTADMDSLIDFVKTGKLPTVAKNGELDDKQLENGWTESKVLALYREALNAKNKRIADEKWKEAVENGFVTRDADGNINYLFSRDTVWTDLIGTVFPEGFNADSMRYIPYGNGAQFEMEIGTDTTKSGSFMHLFEARAPFETYYGGMNKQEVYNLIDERNQLGRYPGMKVGDAVNGNNNAGNWE